MNQSPLVQGNALLSSRAHSEPQFSSSLKGDRCTVAPGRGWQGSGEQSGVPGHRSWLSQVTRPSSHLGRGVTEDIVVQPQGFLLESLVWSTAPLSSLSIHSLKNKPSLGPALSLGHIGQCLRSPQSQSLTQTLPAPRSQGRASRGEGSWA